MRFILSSLAVLTLMALDAFSLGPHEAALLVNSNSNDSLKIAAEYAQARSIPNANIIYLEDLPSNPDIMISREDFIAKIWNPAHKAIEERNLSKQILAWIYSPGFPTTISSKPHVSITGFTFIRTKLPEKEDDVTLGLYSSPLFADPVTTSAKGYRSRSFDRLKSIIGPDMPLPAFMLGYIGTPGNTAEEITACLKKAVSADYSAPEGTVYFITSPDVRAKAREWQFEPVVQELSRLKIKSSILSAPPDNRQDIIGIMMGAPVVKPRIYGTLLPGSFADHLTSFAAVFSTKDQTKCTEWIKAGAAGSAGTVTEPLSAWPKFPHARIFLHYASGCTLIESFYQSVRAPLQILPLGDPLCQPWAPKPDLTIQGIPGNPATTPFTCTGSASYKNPLINAGLEWLVNGRSSGFGENITIDPAGLPPGEHELRLIALTHGSIRSQTFTIRKFSTATPD